MNNVKTIIAFCSPNGTTKAVAEKISELHREDGADVTLVNLGMKGGGDTALQKINQCVQQGTTPVIYIGSPVYGSRAIPPVMDFIERLPQCSGAIAVPFVTWGGVTRGFALYQMAEALQKKGFTLPGAAEVVAAHSMTWKADKPVEAGRPDTSDMEKIGKLVREITEKIKAGSFSGVDISLFKEGRAANFDEVFSIPFSAFSAKMPPKKLNEEACTQCKICADTCPADAITFSPYPEFNDSCIACFSCVRNCPEEAIGIPLEALNSKVQERAANSTEESTTITY
ncbi:MAG TPA: EFR1 family ferrodoxin [Spirochaetota bacterium]|nr:EFR1 family ferrodoxin [Spirochaetota bacterium]HQP50368.1 EFR1 family ferrodoxin [Spirochaetota bacterium]